MKTIFYKKKKEFIMPEDYDNDLYGICPTKYVLEETKKDLGVLALSEEELDQHETDIPLGRNHSVTVKTKTLLDYLEQQNKQFNKEVATYLKNQYSFDIEKRMIEDSENIETVLREIKDKPDFIDWINHPACSMNPEYDYYKVAGYVGPDDKYVGNISIPPPFKSYGGDYILRIKRDKITDLVKEFIEQYKCEKVEDYILCLSEENFMPHIKFDEKYDSISTLLEIGTYFDTRNFYSEEKAKLEAQIAENKRIDEINAKNREIDKKKRYLFDTLNNFEEFRKIDLEKIEKIYELIGQTYEEPKPNPVSEGDAKIAEILSHFEADNSRITPPKREFTFPE